MRKFTVYWLPALVWMTVIFAASGDAHSGERASRFIGPFIRWLLPSLPADDLDRAVFAVRKLAHLFEYAILAALLWRARRQSSRENAGLWQPRHAWFAWFGSVIYSASDEIHQRFVPTRVGTPYDVFIDSCGAALGLLIVWAIGRWRRR